MSAGRSTLRPLSPCYLRGSGLVLPPAGLELTTQRRGSGRPPCAGALGGDPHLLPLQSRVGDETGVGVRHGVSEARLGELAACCLSGFPCLCASELLNVPVRVPLCLVLLHRGGQARLALRPWGPLELGAQMRPLFLKYLLSMEGTRMMKRLACVRQWHPQCRLPRGWNSGCSSSSQRPVAVLNC